MTSLPTGITRTPLNERTRELYDVMPDVSRALARRDNASALALLRTVLAQQDAAETLVEFIRDEYGRMTPPPDPRWVLTAREVATVRAAAAGLTAEETAALQDVSPEAVRSRRRKIIQKLGATNIVEAVIEAHRRGLVS